MINDIKPKTESDLLKDRGFHKGDIVRHFQREMEDLFIIRDFAICRNTTPKSMVIYQELFAPYNTYATEVEIFCSRVDKERYPNINQEYIFEKMPTQPTFQS